VDGLPHTRDVLHWQIDRVRAMSIVATVAAMLGTTVTPDNPILECELPLDGSRFEALIPPVVPAPTFALRKRAKLIFSLADYVDTGVMTELQATVIKAAVADRKNILIAGGTGSGKTTLANAVLNEIAVISPDHRIVIIEDVLELQCSVKNTVFLRTSATIDQVSLLRATLRLRPDRIVVGEVRDKSALALLKAWNTGHPGGIGTVHANSTGTALVRVGQLIQEAGVPAAPELISEAVNLVISIKRSSSGRIVDEVAEVTNWSSATGFELRRLGLISRLKNRSWPSWNFHYFADTALHEYHFHSKNLWKIDAGFELMLVSALQFEYGCHHFYGQAACLVIGMVFDQAGTPCNSIRNR
jgi:P-type conjugative transfer ATPase TrbB